jgi:hypothetical protein
MAAREDPWCRKTGVSGIAAGLGKRNPASMGRGLPISSPRVLPRLGITVFTPNHPLQQPAAAFGFSNPSLPAPPRLLSGVVSRQSMRTVLFQEGAPECPIVAITDFVAAEIVSLRSDVVRLASGNERSVVVDGEVHLTLQTGERDIGILDGRAPCLTCVLRPSAWRQVADLLEPFTEPDQRGYQWLDETGDVKLLISRTGEW